MFTIQQQQSLAWLQQYLAETPKEVIQAEIDAITAMQFEGPTLESYFQNFHKAFIHEEIKTRKRPTRVNNASIFRLKKGNIFNVTNHITIMTNNNIQNKYGKYAKKTATNKILISNVNVTTIENQNKRNTI